MEKNNKVIIISGATCTGKTDASIYISRHIDKVKFEIINFDSLLFYNEVNIGTAKPSQEEMNEIRHHLVNINSISNEINASDFIDLAKEKMLELLSNGITPILVGGSTFYLRALLKGMYESDSTSEEVKNEVKDIYSKYGIEEVINLLNKVDPESLENLHRNDHYRLMRALEYYKQTGNKISEQKNVFDSEDPYDFSKTQFENIDFLHINLEIPKDIHWPLMQKRAHKMIEQGLIEEVQNILDMGFSGEEKPLKSIGYKEVISYLENTISSKEDLCERIYINTRRLAKSQKTFLNKVSPKSTFNYLEDKESILELTSQFLNNS